MDKYKNFVRIEEIKGLLREGKNAEALELTEGMEHRKIKDNCDLMVLAEVYLNNGMLGKARECYTIVYDRKKSRRVAMELVNVCIRLKKADEAEKYFDEYRRMAPNDYFNYIFRYKIDRLKGKPLKEQAEVLEQLKNKYFFDTWGYELAKIYHKMGERDKCLRTCEDVIIWFGDGEAVDKAKTLKALYLGEISLKDLNNPNALKKNNTEEETKKEKGEVEVSSDLDLDVVIDYQMEFDHAVDEIVNKDKKDVPEENQANEERKENLEKPEDYDIKTVYTGTDRVAVEAASAEDNADDIKTANAADDDNNIKITDASDNDDDIRIANPTDNDIRIADSVDNDDIKIAYAAENEVEYTKENCSENQLEDETTSESDSRFNLDYETKEEYIEEGFTDNSVEENSDGYAKEEYSEEAYTEKEFTEEEYSEEEYTEEEYTEEELYSGTEDNGTKEIEDEDIKIRPSKQDYKEIDDPDHRERTVVKHSVHDNDFFTDEIAKAVEQALKEDDAEKRQRAEHSDPKEATREWSRPAKSQASGLRIEPVVDNKTVSKTDSDSELKPKSSTETETKPKKDDRIKTASKKKSDAVKNNTKDFVSDNTMGSGSKLIDAVERELGIVGSSPEEKEKTEKKSWFERRKEKHKAKELKKKEEQRRSEEASDKEKLEKIREAELEKQRFIESEKRKDRKKFLEHQRQLSMLATEKALQKQQEDQQPVQRDNIAEKQAIEDFSVDINDFREIREMGKPEDGIYRPKSLKCIEIPVNSIVGEYLAGTGKTLENYFGFFACQKDMSSQILKVLERLLEPDEEYSNYCIIGDKGAGKKAIIHGFAKFMADCGKIASSQTVWTDADKINSIDLSEKTDKLRGRCLVIDQAGSLDIQGIEDVAKVLERLHRKTMLVLADYKRNMVELFKNREGFEDMFGPRVIIPTFNQDDLFDYVDYKVDTAGFVFESAAYDLMSKRIKSIMRATEEGALARTEKYVVKTIDNAEQRNGEEYIKQTLENTKHTRSNVITVKDLPENL